VGFFVRHGLIDGPDPEQLEHGGATSPSPCSTRWRTPRHVQRRFTVGY